jgi:hypothetical protein
LTQVFEVFWEDTWGATLSPAPPAPRVHRLLQNAWKK